MRLKNRSFLAALVAAAALSGCDFEFTGPDDALQAVVRVQVTGGIAGADYTYEVSSQGHVTGVACVNLCAFAAGDTLHHLTPAQRRAFLDGLNASGLPTSGRPVDFETECCDRFTYRVVYTSGREVRSFSGGIENFPRPLQVLVRALQRYYEGAPPVILSQSAGLAGFRTDAVELLGARVAGGVLALDVRYAGGCQQHDLDAVAWTGWMESNPVQVGVALAHDAHGETCKALVTSTLTFDPEPLRLAYVAAYGDAPATLVLRVEVPGSGRATQVPLSF